MIFFFDFVGDHRDLPVLSHSFPTRRAADLGAVLGRRRGGRGAARADRGAPCAGGRRRAPVAAVGLPPALLDGRRDPHPARPAVAHRSPLRPACRRDLPHHPPPLPPPPRPPSPAAATRGRCPQPPPPSRLTWQPHL